MLTTTVGLVVVAGEHRPNVMSAEWTYFLNKDPLYVAVVLSSNSLTRELIEGVGEFSVTLCSAEQAEIAEFAGSFSGRDIDKTATDALMLCDPEVTRTPWVAGGVAAFECLARQDVRLPDYRMYVGEAVATHRGDGASPLVKHGSMHRLGSPVEKQTVVASAELVCGGSDWSIRVAATGQAPASALWHITLLHPDGAIMPLCEFPEDEYGDLLADVEVPAVVSEWPLPLCRISVHRNGLKPGLTGISTRYVADRNADPITFS